MNRHDLNCWHEQFTDAGLNCKEALYFAISIIGTLAFILLVLP